MIMTSKAAGWELHDSRDTAQHSTLLKIKNHYFWSFSEDLLLRCSVQKSCSWLASYISHFAVNHLMDGLYRTWIVISEQELLRFHKQWRLVRKAPQFYYWRRISCAVGADITGNLVTLFQWSVPSYLTQWRWQKDFIQFKARFVRKACY